MNRGDMFCSGTSSVAFVSILLLSTFYIPFINTSCGGTDALLHTRDMQLDESISHGGSLRWGGAFIENLGQWSGEIRFVATTDFGRVAITDRGILYDLKAES
ncbi:MAG: hypothetical protein ACMUFK_05475, partial [Thermoplasmatota archaeon]